MTAWVFEALHCPTLLNEIKKTKLQIYTSPQAGINILLVAALLSPIISGIPNSPWQDYECHKVPANSPMLFHLPLTKELYGQNEYCPR
jgi:hypothetical protein